MKSQKKILIVGTLPLPIGGVTVHVDRLINALKKQEEIKFVFKDNTLQNLLKAPFFLYKNTIHLHSSSPYVRLYYVFLSKILLAKCIVTIHGDLNRYKSSFKNFLDKLTVKFSYIPIVLNNKSYSIANKYNNNAVIISSFIPPSSTEKFNVGLQKRIDTFKETYDFIFCTNAYNLTFDKEGIEIYGIFEIINYFLEKRSLGLIFSDPSGAYKKEFKERGIQLTDNILHIVEPHSFYEVLKNSKASIRNTSTDGDSLSIKESLFLNKITLCTDVVSRPKQTVLYSRGNLETIINDLDIVNKNLFLEDVLVENGYIKIIELYKKSLKNG